MGNLLDKFKELEKSEKKETSQAKIIPEEEQKITKPEKKTIQDKKIVFYGPAKQTDINTSSLIIALNYAINTIKNKKEVKNKDIVSTYYQYYLQWNKLREYFMKQQGLI